MAIVARNSSPCVLVMMPNVGPALRPVITCSGIASSAPFSIVVTGMRLNVRPSFSFAHRGAVLLVVILKILKRGLTGRHRDHREKLDDFLSFSVWLNDL